MKSRVEAAKKNFIIEEDEYYEEKWEEPQEQETSDRRKDQGVLESKEYKELKEIQSPSKKEDLRKSKLNTKHTKRDNFNIVFNNNTYNLNIIDPYN